MQSIKVLRYSTMQQTLRVYISVIQKICRKNDAPSKHSNLEKSNNPLHTVVLDYTRINDYRATNVQPFNHFEQQITALTITQ